MRSIGNFIIVILLALLISCGSKLSEKERSALREEMNRREIRQIRDDEIVNHALGIGRAIREDSTSGKLEAMEAERRTYSSRPQNEILSGLWDAYQTAWEQNEDPGDNIQRDYPDDLIYSYSRKADSAVSMVIIRIPKKNVILSLQSE